MCELNIRMFGIAIREEGKHMITGLIINNDDKTKV
jgi:hypothetical protein